MTNISPPPQDLPWDVLLQIFQLSSTRTLAVLGGVSFDFLLGTSTLLYEDVVLKSQRSLARLFCARNNPINSSRLRPCLSLLQIRTLTLDLSGSSSIPAELAFSLSRMVFDTEPLPLELVRILSYHRGSSPHALLHRVLLPHLNPTRLEYSTRSRQKDQSCWTTLDRAPVLANWDRIQSVSFEGTLPYLETRSDGDLLASLPPPSLSRRRIIRLHLSTLLYTNRPDPFSLLKLFVEDHLVDRTGSNAMQDGSVVLVVERERERVEVETAVGELEERRRSMFVTEMKAGRGSPPASIDSLGLHLQAILKSLSLRSPAPRGHP